MKNYQYILSMLLLSMVSTLFSCTNEENETGKEGTQVRSITYKLNTRAIDTNARDEEMMKSLTLFFVKDGLIEKKITFPILANVETQTVEVELETGPTTLYGFANYSDTQIRELGLDAEQGSNMPDVTGKTLVLPNNYDISTHGIPMNNQKSFVVTNSAGQNFSMELVRMLCKIGVTFSDPDNVGVQVKSFRINPITGSAVKLMPTNDNADLSFPETPRTTEAVVYSFNDGAAENGREYTFYINESQVSSTDWFHLTVTSVTGNNTTEDVRMSFTGNDYRELKRNDYLKLPILLGDYKLELDIMSYPPIGGYPAAYERENDYYCIFPGGGPIIIRPTIIKTSTREVVEPQSWQINFADANPALFETGKEPTAVVNGEILATMKETAGSGSALLEISAILENGVGRSYKIYIQNQANN